MPVEYRLKITAKGLTKKARLLTAASLPLLPPSHNERSTILSLLRKRKTGMTKDELRRELGQKGFIRRTLIGRIASATRWLRQKGYIEQVAI